MKEEKQKSGQCDGLAKSIMDDAVLVLAVIGAVCTVAAIFGRLEVK